MSTNLKAIAARYAGAMKAAGGLSSADVEDRPTISEIWHWRLEEAATMLATSKRNRPYTSDYDHLFQYGHRHCLNSREDVQQASDDVLLESMRLPTVERWGWLHFIVRELGMTSLIINNWGWGCLKGFESVSSAESVEQRRTQAALYFLDIMRERGLDPLAQVREMAREFNNKTGCTEGEFIEAIRGEGRFEWICFVYDSQSVIVPQDAKAAPEIVYTGEHRAQFAKEIREAAARRRAVWNVDYSCECERWARTAAEEKEREGIERVLNKLFPPPDVGVVPEGKLLETLCSLVRDTYDAREGKFAPPHASERLELFLARNEKARELLRLPEHRELAMIIRFYVLWLHIAPDVHESKSPCYSSFRCEACKRDPLHNLAGKYPPTAADAAMRVRQFA